MAGLAREEHWTFRTEIDNSQIAGRIYVISQGRITLRRQSAYSSAPELQSLGPGDIFGEVDKVGSLYFLQQPPVSPSPSAGSGNVSPSPSSTAANPSVGIANPPQIPSSTHRKSLPIPSLQKTPSVSIEDCYFVDSVEGCHLLGMLVEQLVRSLDLTAGSVVDAENGLGTSSLAAMAARATLKSSQEADEEDGEEVELADLKTVATLGVGGFGRVNLVKHFDTDKVFALKILNKAHVKEMNQQEHVLNERAILLACKSEFIVRMYKTYRDSERLYMLLEYCPGGEVWTMLRNWGRFDEVTSRYYCAAALEAFDYLHRRFIIYRDLKPENMLLDKNGIPKLADFGFAKQLKAEGARTWTFCGTAEYVAPEIILNKGQDTAVDIWSLGIFMYELISGSPPFASTDPMHTYNSILKGVQMLAWPRYMTETAKALICKFCRRDPTQRLGYGRIEDARRDAWFQSFDFAAFRNLSMRPPIRPKVRNITDTQNFDRYPSTDNFACGIDESGWDANF